MKSVIHQHLLLHGIDPAKPQCMRLAQLKQGDLLASGQVGIVDTTHGLFVPGGAHSFCSGPAEIEISGESQRQIKMDEACSCGPDHYS